MRREWQRVRCGETVYRVAKVVAMVATDAAFIGLAVLVVTILAT